jgi:isopenicillin-N epimerase
VRETLGRYLNADHQDIILAANVTVAINAVARSLPLQPGDEVLGTNHEYGAMDLTWRSVCAKAGAHYITSDIPVPVQSAEVLIDQLWRRVTPRTRVIFFSHITSPTALIFPVKEICRRAREQGIITVVDGAHAIGQIPVDVAAIDADYYAGNCHKWLCAPKGAGFLHVRRDRQAAFTPMVISWGADAPTFAEQNHWQGTQDIAAYLTIPAAIDFQRDHDWPEVRRRCHAMAVEAQGRIGDLTGLEPLSPASETWFAQMVTVPLGTDDIDGLKTRLYDRYKVEVPVIGWNDRGHTRISFQGYNSQNDLDRLVDALAECLPQG